MTEKKKNKWFTNEWKRDWKKPIIILIICIIFPIVTILVVDLYTGTIMGSNENISWEMEHGEIYYLGLYDDYYYENRTDSDDYIRSFKSVLRSEILDKKDLSADWDDQDDLVIMSSLLYGNDNLNSIEVPNWFDMYDLFGIDFDLGAFSNYQGSVNTTDLNEWMIPNALHFQYSSPYHTINSILDLFNQGQLDTIPDNISIDSFFEWMIINYFINNDYQQSFENEIIGEQPQNFSISTIFPLNNSVKIEEDPSDSLNSIMVLNQDQDTKDYSRDDLLAVFNILNYLNSTELGDDLELDTYWYDLERLSFDLEMNGNDDDHDILIDLTTEFFNISGSIDSSSKDFSGLNGIKLKISNGYLLYCVGDYIYDLATSSFRETFPNEKGWINTSFPVNAFYNDVSPFGKRFNIQIIPDGHYGYVLSLRGEFQSVGFLFDIPMYLDCPYDFLSGNDCYDYNTNDYRIFRFLNYTNLEFSISNTGATDTKDLIDNILYEGTPYYKMISKDSIEADLYYSQLYLFSLYHTLFYPNEFQWDSIIDFMSLINDFNYMLFNITDFFEIINSDSTLEIIIPYDSVNSSKEWMRSYLLDSFGIDCAGLMDGTIDVKYNIVFDKVNGLLKESYLTFRYNELDIIREFGMKLVGACKSISEEIQDQIALYDDYPAYPSSDWITEEEFDSYIDEMIELRNILVISLLMTGIITIIISVSINEGIRRFSLKRSR